MESTLGGPGSKAPIKVRKEFADTYGFRQPSRVQVVGSTGEGKTEWLINYLMEVGPFHYHIVIWVGPARSLRQDGLDRLQDDWGDSIFFVEGLDTDKVDAIIAKAVTKKWKVALVLDDLMSMGTKAQKEWVGEMQIAGRHDDVSIFELLQAIFPEGNRVHRLQTGVFVLFKFYAKDEARRLFQQTAMHKDEQIALSDAYEKITEKRFRCMIYDQSARNPDLPLLVRDTDLNNLLPEFSGWNHERATVALKNEPGEDDV